MANTCDTKTELTGGGGVDETKETTTTTTSAPSTSQGDNQSTAMLNKPIKVVKIKEPPVSDMMGYSVVKIEEKHGIFHNAIPVMPLPIAVILCLLNIAVPGSGTLFSAPLSFCCPSRLSHHAKASGINLLSAVLQMLTFLVIVGWIWSILWGMTMVQLSLASSRKSKNVNVPYYVRRQSSVE